MAWNILAPRSCVHPRDTKSLHNLGEILRAQGKYEESLGVYLSAVGINPDSPKALFGAGAALFELRRYSEALSSMERALVLEIDPSMVPALHHLMGQALLKMGRPGEAEVQFDLSMKTLRWLSLCYAFRGNGTT